MSSQQQEPTNTAKKMIEDADKALRESLQAIEAKVKDQATVSTLASSRDELKKIAQDTSYGSDTA